MKIKGAVFDVDGTLLDSMPMWMHLGERYLLKKNITPEENLGEKLFPMTMEEGAWYLIDTYHLQDCAEIVIRDTIEIAKDFYVDEVQLKTGALELLNFLSEHNVSCSIATTADKELVESAFLRLGIMKYFRGIFTCSEVGAGKEEPLVYLKAAEILEALPKEVLVFEDSLHGIETAKKAGFKTIGIYDEASIDKQKEIKNTAYMYGTSFLELQSKLQKEW